MSMISAQIDELRSMAESVGLAMPQAATLMMEAADTIWQLRDDLQRANVENAKLRELVRDYERCTMHADCSMCEYDGKLSTHCPFSPCFPDTDELCELGVEEDE
jgi:hypothetical protein